jgi:hypothetical protein
VDLFVFLEMILQALIIDSERQRVEISSVVMSWGTLRMTTEKVDVLGADFGAGLLWSMEVMIVEGQFVAT